MASCEIRCGILAVLGLLFALVLGYGFCVALATSRSLRKQKKQRSHLPRRLLVLRARLRLHGIDPDDFVRCLTRACPWHEAPLGMAAFHIKPPDYKSIRTLMAEIKECGACGYGKR